MKTTELRLKSGTLSLNPFVTTFDFAKAKHLLNRCMFGARYSEINFLVGKSASDVLDFLMQDPAQPQPPPLGVKDTDEEVAVGTTWINTKYNGSYRSARLYSYNNWWIGRLINQNVSLIEKMTLFWHNHFVIETDTVSNTNYNYHYNKLITDQALGNFKTLSEEMTVNVGMLQYLDGVKNVDGSPNENYARELLELFTVGKGQLIEEGNYTNYTEHDIREAAKILTGWSTDANTDSSYFNSSKHDKTDKVFSDSFENQIISNNEENEYKDLINMIFDQKETARYLVRKLYRWFVYFRISDDIEQNIIEPLANLFIENNFEIKPVLKTLLSSEHFFDEAYCGAMIKNPLEFTIGLLRQLEYNIPDESQLQSQYGFWNTTRTYARNQDLDIGNPPDVAGWPAWYLPPMYNELWINTATIPARSAVVKAIIYGGIRPVTGADKIYFDPFKAAYLATDPSDIDILLDTFTKILFPMAPSEAQIVELKEILIPGLPDFEWTAEWNKYIRNPDDENQKTAVGNSLKNLLSRICSMAEYQLI
jgi:hypothetical protein